MYFGTVFINIAINFSDPTSNQDEVLILAEFYELFVYLVTKPDSVGSLKLSHLATVYFFK